MPQQPFVEAARILALMCETLSALPRARTFHVALLRKNDRNHPEELYESLEQINEASLLRGLFSRIAP